MGIAERIWAHIRIPHITPRHDETVNATNQQCVQHLKLVLCRPALSVTTLVWQKQTAQSDKDVTLVRKAGKMFA